MRTLGSFFVSLFLLSGSMSYAQCVQGDCANGIGTEVYDNGDRYSGEFVDNTRNGEGTYLFSNGDKYVGEWRKGYMSGEGTYTYVTGKIETGLWENGNFKGAVVVKDAAEATPIRKTGCLAGDCRNGKGYMVYPNGDKYEGDFVKGKREGKGTFYYNDGSVYDGFFKADDLSGSGTMTYADGKVLKGVFKAGEYIGEKPEEAVVAAQPTLQAKGNDKPEAVDTKEEGPDVMEVYALVIGVAKYSAMPALNYTDDDAYQVYAFLKSPEGGALSDDNIKVLIDEKATYQNIVASMAELFNKADNNDLVVLYFSGHGLEGCYLPSDYDGTNNKLYYSTMNALLKDSQAKYKLVLADACHSGSVLAKRSFASAEETVRNFYAAFTNVRGGTSFILSSKAEEFSLESNGLRQGLYSHFLIKGMKGGADVDGNKIVTVKELADYLSTNVKKSSANYQSPVLSSDNEDMPVSVVRKR